MLGLVVVLPLIDADDESVRIVFSANQKKVEEIKQPKMENPRFQGVDAQNQPYTVTAISAIQLDGKRVAMKKMQADIMLKNNQWITISADEGVLDLTNKKLDLKGQVHLQQDEGYEFLSDAAEVDLNTKTARGHLPVEGQGPMGNLNAKGFEILENTTHIRFGGPVRMTLYPEGAR